MSDNPADSLRRELEAARWDCPGCGRGYPAPELDRLRARITELESELEAARADERERITQAIDKLKRTAYAHHASVSIALDEAMDLVRSAGAEPQERSDG